MSASLINTLTDNVKKDFGESEIAIYANNDSPSRYFSSNIADSSKSRFKYTMGIIENTGYYKVSKNQQISFVLRGMDWNDVQQKLKPVTLDQEKNLLPFEGRKVVISSSRAKKYGLTAGDTVDMNIDGNLYKFTIAGTAQLNGVFSADSDLAIVPKDTLSSICDKAGSISKLYIKLKDPAKKEQVLKDLSAEIKDYDVAETITKQTFEDKTETFSTVLYIMLALIISLGIFIIYSSFKVITSERLPLLGTLRSIGAGKKASEFMLICESILYGIIGGIIGCATGIGVLYLLAFINADGGGVNIILNVIQFPVTIAAAVLMSVMSSIIPIIKVTRFPVKDIILNKVEIRERSKKVWKLAAGIILLLVPFILPPMFDGETAMIVDCLIMVLVIAGIILIIPYFTSIFTFLFKKVSTIIFGNIGALAVKNLRENKNILNNITLLAVGIATILMVFTSGKSTTLGIVSFNSNTLKYDINFSIPMMDKNTEVTIKSVNGVKDALGYYSMQDIKISGANEPIRLFEGVDASKFLDYYGIKVIDQDAKAVFRNLNSGRNIILGKNIALRNGKKIGDKITLVLNKQKMDYTIIGLLDITEADGSFAIISDSNFTADTGRTAFTNMLIITNTTPEKVLTDLRNKFSKSVVTASTVQEHKNSIIKDTNKIFSMMDGIALLTIIIGIFGVLNNLTVSFNQRKRSFAVLRSMGMSKVQIVQMISLEALSSGLIGGAAGLLGGGAMISVVPYLTRAIIATIPLALTATPFILAAASGVLITLLASISSAVKSSKLSIVQSIKFE
ncbi:MAG: FtsX-like permease family protein [Bacillota bacterium]|nr:FtsX-like permease family protein [Bacillota bacterium]